VQVVRAVHRHVGPHDPRELGRVESKREPEKEAEHVGHLPRLPRGPPRRGREAHLGRARAAGGRLVRFRLARPEKRHEDYDGDCGQRANKARETSHRRKQEEHILPKAPPRDMS
jgi:hypothetical protein